MSRRCFRARAWHALAGDALVVASSMAGALAAAGCGGDRGPIVTSGAGVSGAARATAPSLPRPPLPTPATRVEVQGHRGARAAFPEESLRAFTHALEVGADTLELDVAVTRDDAVVVLHDLTINDALCTTGDGQRLTARPKVRSLLLAEVQSYDCGSLPHPRFPKQARVPGARIATLAEVFDLVERSSLPAARAVRFNIELKSLPSEAELVPPPDAFARAVLAIVDAHRLRDRVTLQSFDHRMLLAARRAAPAVPISLLIEGTLPDLVAMAEAAHAEIVSPDLAWITADEVLRLHARGIRVIPWTANTPSEWDYLVRLGVDGIITDDPAGLIAHLQERRLR